MLTIFVLFQLIIPQQTGRKRHWSTGDKVNADTVVFNSWSIVDKFQGEWLQH